MSGFLFAGDRCQSKPAAATSINEWAVLTGINARDTTDLDNAPLTASRPLREHFDDQGHHC
jgi:hypothetical protein